MLLPNGTMIKNDVIETFNAAISCIENQRTNGGINWNFVESDMYMELSSVYASTYIDECFETLADELEGVA